MGSVFVPSLRRNRGTDGYARMAIFCGLWLAVGQGGVFRQR